MAGVKGRSGGARATAGRKSRAEKYATPIARAEKRIADKLPLLIDHLFELAEGVRVEEVTLDGGPAVYQKPPDFKAASYLVDRILGKPVQAVEADVTSGGEKLGIAYVNDWRGASDPAALPASGAADGEEAGEAL